MKAKTLRHNQTLHQFTRLAPSAGDQSRPLAEQNLLFWLAAETNPPTPTQIAEAMGLTKAAISKMMNPLLADGLITKQLDLQDNRSFTLHLTEAGVEAVDTLGSDYLKPLTTLHDGLGNRRYKRLMKLLGQANQVLIEEE